MRHRTFLTHFVIMLAAAGGAALAALDGIPQAIFAGDASHVTSAIAALFAVTTIYLARQALALDYVAACREDFHYASTLALELHFVQGQRTKCKDKRPIPTPESGSSFGHYAKEASVMLGLLGTVIGLSMQLAAAHGSVESLSAFSTQFASTGCGIVSALLIFTMTTNIEAAKRRLGEH